MLKVSGLTVKFSNVTAVKGVSLEVRPGETLGIVGESGSGKTTTGRAILRINEPAAGEIDYRTAEGNTVEITGADRQTLKTVRQEIRMIFQDPVGSLDPRKTVRRSSASRCGWPASRPARRSTSGSPT